VALPLITVMIDVDARVTPRGWLTLAEAAEALGVSAHSVRRKARAGQLVARQVATDRGPAWRVLLHPDTPGGHPDAHGDHLAAQGDATVVAAVTTHASPSSGHPDATLTAHPDAMVTGQGDTLCTADLVALLREREARIDELTGELMARTEAATVWQERARILSDQFALTAPKSPLDAPTGTQSVKPTTDTLSGRLRPLAPWLLVVLAVVAVGALLVVPR
jgi:hypothetical protein